MARSRKVEAFTRRELVAVIVALVVLGLFLVPALERAAVPLTSKKL
jgi:hypothetical protein